MVLTIILRIIIITRRTTETILTPTAALDTTITIIDEMMETTRAVIARIIRIITMIRKVKTTMIKTTTTIITIVRTIIETTISLKDIKGNSRTLLMLVVSRINRMIHRHHSSSITHSKTETTIPTTSKVIIAIAAIIIRTIEETISSN